MYDKYAELRAIVSGEAQATTPIPAKWSYEIDRPLLGTIKGFSSFHHDRFGLQETVIVESESGELVSAILNQYLQNGMRIQKAEVNDLILIQFLGKELSVHNNTINKYNLVVQKAYP
jgi:hypothetical protein